MTNYWLNLINLVDSDICTFCEIECESLLHLFWSCRYAADFWGQIERWWSNKTGYMMYLERNDVFIGSSKFTKLQNHILILGKYCIYSARCKKVIPSFLKFETKLFITLKMEENIARENNRIDTFIDKWSILI